MFFSTLCSVFRFEMYRKISFCLEGDKLANTAVAFLLSAKADVHTPITCLIKIAASISTGTNTKGIPTMISSRAVNAYIKTSRSPQYFLHFPPSSEFVVNPCWQYAHLLALFDALDGHRSYEEQTEQNPTCELRSMKY